MFFSSSVDPRVLTRRQLAEDATSMVAGSSSTYPTLSDAHSYGSSLYTVTSSTANDTTQSSPSPMGPSIPSTTSVTSTPTSEYTLDVTNIANGTTPTLALPPSTTLSLSSVTPAASGTAIHTNHSGLLASIRAMRLGELKLSNPGVIVALVAASIGIFCTAMSIVYCIRVYRRHRRAKKFLLPLHDGADGTSDVDLDKLESSTQPNLNLEKANAFEKQLASRETYRVSPKKKVFDDEKDDEKKDEAADDGWDTMSNYTYGTEEVLR